MSIQDRVTEFINDEINALLPIKTDAYVAWNDKSKDFYVSTTEEEEFNGRISMKEIISIFIENYEQGKDGIIDNQIGMDFILELELSIQTIKARF